VLIPVSSIGKTAFVFFVAEDIVSEEDVEQPDKRITINSPATTTLLYVYFFMQYLK